MDPLWMMRGLRSLRVHPTIRRDERWRFMIREKEVA